MSFADNPFHAKQASVLPDRAQVTREIMGNEATAMIRDLLDAEEMIVDSDDVVPEEDVAVFDIALSPEERQRQERIRRAQRMLSEVEEILVEGQNPILDFDAGITVLPLVAHKGTSVDAITASLREMVDGSALMIAQRDCAYKLVRTLAKLGRLDDARRLYAKSSDYHGFAVTPEEQVNTLICIGDLQEADRKVKRFAITSNAASVARTQIEELILSGYQAEAAEKITALRAKFKPPYTTASLQEYMAFVKTVAVAGMPAKSWLDEATRIYKEEHREGRMNITGDMLRDLCDAHTALGEFHVAERYLGFIDQKDGKSLMQRQALVLAYEKRGRHEEALVALQELVSLSKDMFLMARLYAEIDELEMADKLFEAREASVQDPSERFASVEHALAKTTIALRWLEKLRQS